MWAGTLKGNSRPVSSNTLTEVHFGKNLLLLRNQELYPEISRDSLGFPSSHQPNSALTEVQGIAMASMHHRRLVPDKCSSVLIIQFWMLTMPGYANRFCNTIEGSAPQKNHHVIMLVERLLKVQATGFWRHQALYGAWLMHNVSLCSLALTDQEPRSTLQCSPSSETDSKRRWQDQSRPAQRHVKRSGNCSVQEIVWMILDVYWDRFRIIQMSLFVVWRHCRQSGGN